MRLTIKVRSLRPGDILSPTRRVVQAVSAPMRRTGERRAHCVVAFADVEYTSRWGADTEIAVDRPDVTEAAHG
jgi:hypothetical protein